jgi:hypothetical protein
VKFPSLDRLPIGRRMHLITGLVVLTLLATAFGT